MAKANKAKQKKWEQHIQSWKKSRLSLAGYCRTHKLKTTSFRYWVLKNKTNPKPHPFIQLPIKSIPPLPTRHTPSLILTINDRYKIEIGETFQSATLSKLIQTLDGLNVSTAI